jgi:signal transduction histidine kinase
MPKTFLLFFLLTISGFCFAQAQKVGYYQDRAEDFFSHKKYKQANQYADSALRLLVSSDNKESIAGGYMWLYELHAISGNYEDAIKDLKLSELFKDSLALEKQDSVVSSLRANLAREIKARSEEVSSLETRVRDITASASVDQRNFYILLSSIFVIALVSVIALVQRKDRMKKIIDQQAEDLKHLQSFKEKLFTVLSYDLKNSLSAFENLTQGLSNQGAFKKEEMPQLLSNLRQTAVDLKSTLANVIHWAGYQSNSRLFSPETFDCKDLATEVVEKFKPDMLAKNQTCDVFVPDRQYVYADREMIGIILENLVSNAVHFTRPGGVITCFSGRKDGLVTIGVKDTGVGIKEVDIQKLFDIKEDFHTIGRPSQKGAGVGLVLSKELVERNGGRMYVESELARGSTFYFTLPEKKN